MILGKTVGSSYQINGLGKVSDLCVPHHEYLCLGKETTDRQQTYRELVSQHVDGELLKEIRRNAHKGMAITRIIQQACGRSEYSISMSLYDFF